MTDGSDFARYVDARWPDLVGGLEDEGVPADDARLAVAETLLASRRTWSRRVRDENVDVALWAEVRERVGLPARPGEPAPHGVRPFDPHDPPDAWFARAEALRGARRRRGLVRVAAGVVVARGARDRLAVVGVPAAGGRGAQRRPTRSPSSGTPRASSTSRTWW